MAPDHDMDAGSIARRQFASTRKGFDQDEVRAYLRELADVVDGLRRSEAEQRARVDAAESRVTTIEDLDEHRLVELLGEETARILDAGRAASTDIRRKAEESAERLISEANDEAHRLLAVAEDEATRRRTDVMVEMGALRAEASAELDRRRAEGAELVAEIRRAAQAEADELIDEAQVVRERMLGDLARRRRTAREQLERLNAARERLLAAYDVVRRTVDEATSELTVALPAARLAGETAMRRVSDEPEPTVEELEGLVTMARIAGLLDQSALEPEEDDDPVVADPEPAVAEPAARPEPWSQPRSEPAAAAAERESRAEPTSEASSGWSGAEPAVAEAASGAPAQSESGRAESWSTSQPEPSVPAPRSGSWSTSHPGSTAGTTPPQTGAEPDSGRFSDRSGSVSRSGAEGVTSPSGPQSVEDDEPSRPEPSAAGDEDARAEPSPARWSTPAADEEPAPTEHPAAPAGPAEADGEYADHEVDEWADEDGDDEQEYEDEAPAANNVSDLFARLKADTEAAAVEADEADHLEQHAGVAVLTDDHDATDEHEQGYGDDDYDHVPHDHHEGHDSESQEGAADEGEHGHDRQGDDDGAADRGDYDHVRQGDDDARAQDGDGDATDEYDEDDESAYASAPVAGDDDLVQLRDSTLAAVEQDLNRRLKRVLADEQNEVLDLLRRTKPSSSEELLPALGSHTARYTEAAREELGAAAAWGAAAVGGEPDGSFDALAVELSQTVVEPLRDRIARSFVETGGDLEEVTGRLRSLYREWKGQHIAAAVRHYSAAAYAQGAYGAMPDGTPLRWLVDRTSDPCPDADDNALAGAVCKGEAFPTGDHCPPAHVGCRCMVVPAE